MLCAHSFKLAWYIIDISEYLLVVEVAICALSKEYSNAEAFLMSIVNIICQPTSYAFPTEFPVHEEYIEQLLSGMRDQLQLLDQMTMLPISSTLADVLESLYKYIHSNALNSKDIIENCSALQKQRRDLENRLDIVESKLVGTENELALLIKTKASNDERNQEQVRLQVPMQVKYQSNLCIVSCVRLQVAIFQQELNRTTSAANAAIEEHAKYVATLTHNHDEQMQRIIQNLNNSNEQKLKQITVHPIVFRFNIKINYFLIVVGRL
jgi:hypothetical protein